MGEDTESPPPADDPLGLEALWRLVEPAIDSDVSDPLVGTTIGGVLIKRVIAEGGMGRVYEGWQDPPGRLVAVKVLRPGPTARAAVHRFLREARILGQLRHPWICQIYTAGTFEAAGAELPYFVMEFIPDALPITDYVHRRALPPSERLTLFTQVCDAVAHAHTHGVVHRDLKPGNVLVDSAGHPKVIDFGIARGDAADTDHVAMAMTATGELLGTVQYMSPEQVDSTTTIDARSDVYSLGVILHELVTGQLPYDLAGLPLLEAVRRIRKGSKPVHRVALIGTRGVAHVVDRCLQKDPRRRYSDAAGLAADLRRSLDQCIESLSDRALFLLRDVVWSVYRRRHVVTSMAVLGLFAAIAVTRHKQAIRLPPLDVVSAEHPVLPFVAVPPLSDAVVSFRHSFTSVLDADADRYLVEFGNMTKWNDPREDLRVNYWGPAANDQEGFLVYRLTFPGRTARIFIDTELSCWDFDKHHGGFGRGASAVEASRDGTRWITIRDDIARGTWGSSWRLKGELPPELLGTSELWLRLRFLTQNAEPKAGYTVAQFARAVPGNGRKVFSLEADCAPSDAR